MLIINDNTYGFLFLSQDVAQMRRLVISILILEVLAGCCVPALSFKILALVPYCGKSHWYIFRPLVEELAKRGNEVTVVSHHPRETPMANYRDISLAHPLSVPVHSKDANTIGTKSRITEMHVVLNGGVEQVCREGLRHPNIQKLIRSNETFDLLITEIFNADCYLGFVYKFRAPFIAIRTAPLSPWSNDRIGNPDNPSYCPNSVFGKPSRMNFRDRLENVIATLYYKWLYGYYNKECTAIARRHFGDDMPNLEMIARNTSVILVNSHFVPQYGRPLVPGIKEVAGIHLRPNKSLPKDIKDWIEGSDKGVIYFSLGSMLKSSSISNQKKSALLDAFAELPYRVLMKWEENSIKDLPPNVRIFAWAPQYDILCHPKVKLFISHAGMLSSTESVYSATPMIAIPAFGDQPTNAALLEERGFAVVLHYVDITKDVILAAVKKVLDDPSYAKRAKEMSLAIRDRIVPPVEEAAYWAEYVARHKGAPFLRSPALELPLYQYLLLDVVATLVLVTLTILWLLWFLLRLMVTKVCRKCPEQTDKRKQKKKN